MFDKTALIRLKLARLARILSAFAAAIAASLSQGVAEQSEAEANDQVEALLAPLRERFDPEMARVIEFNERRFFSFRREPTQLRGVARVQEDQGLSIFYPEEGKGMIIHRDGVLLRSISDSGRVRSRRARNVDAELPLLLDALFHLDLQAMRERYNVELAPSENGDTIELKPLESANESVESISIHIGDDDTLGFSIRLSGGRRIEIERVSETVVERFDEETIRLFFAAP